jgi:hypothetical protein
MMIEKIARPRIECENGLSMSVQASEFAYCQPRENEGPYTHVEVGFPNREVAALMPYIEMSDGDPTESVYPWVPIEVIVKIIEEAGGARETEWEQPGLPKPMFRSLRD